MRKAWGRPPKDDIWGDIQALAVWIFIVGIVGYLLFPDFFQSVYNHLTASNSNLEEGGEISLPASDMDYNYYDYYYEKSNLPNVYSSIYTGDSEISDGYWAIFVKDNEFQQLHLTTESYTFILRLIDGDRKADVKNTLLLAANGHIRKYIVSDEVYNIITNLSQINLRSGQI